MIWSIVFALLAADRARRRKASVVLWGAMTFAVVFAAGLLGTFILAIPAGIGLAYAAANVGKVSQTCPRRGQVTRIDAAACPHCGASPQGMFGSGV